LEKIFIGLGSNVGNREAFIQKAIEYLSEEVLDINQSPIFVSKAVGFTKQPDFYNIAISGFTALSPENLLVFTKEIEKKVGRIKRFRWGPREIDIDILFYSNKIIKKENLIIPHPRLHERDFVLQPLVYLQPNLIHPVFKKTMTELLSNLETISVIRTIPIKMEK